MATLVTGGTGFVGSNIVRTLAERGHEVVCLDLVPPDDLVRDYIRPWTDRITFAQGDIVSPDDLESLVEHDITGIVHAAVFTGVLSEVEEARSRSIVDINVMGTTNVLELARRLPLRRFLYVSSGSVYGDRLDPQEVLQEDVPLRPRTLYAATKYTSELLTRRYGELYGFETASVRLGGPYGPMERVTGHRANQSVLKEWTGNIVRGEPIRVGDRAARRSFTYVKDIAAGIHAVLDAPTLSYEAYNHTSVEWVPLDQVIEALRELRPGIEVVDVPPTEIPGSGNAIDATRLREDVGFVPEFDLASGLADYMAWRATNQFTA